MMRGIATLATGVSLVLLPWPFTAVLAVGVSLFEPLVPLAAGILADTLYYTPQVSAMPHFSLYGGLVTVAAYFVQSRLKTSIIGE